MEAAEASADVQQVTVTVWTDGMLRARCKAQLLGHSRVFLQVDPLPYKPDSELELCIADATGISPQTRNVGMVARRTADGVEVALRHPGS